MIICRQGNGHYLNGLNNQDYGVKKGNLMLLTDGCSEATFSEVGTRLFIQQFIQLDDCTNINKFESNVEKTFKKIISAFAGSADQKNQFITNNMLFTILACFELEDMFVVKFIGDGYIITVNHEDMVSYIRLFYGKRPPYFAYNKLKTTLYANKLNFKTFEFSKKDFKKVGIASDGFAPIAENKIEDNFEPYIIGHRTEYSPEGIIRSNQSSFYDDITILI